MSNGPYFIETTLLLLLAFLIGCVIGFFARKWLSGPVTSAAGTPPAAPLQPEPAAPAAPAAAKKPEHEPAPKTTPAAAAVAGKPETLDAPRGGVADDLKKISGIGPKIETLLNGLGIYHFDQISAWDSAEADWVNSQLKFKGRIERENWIAQAKELAGK